MNLAKIISIGLAGLFLTFTTAQADPLRFSAGSLSGQSVSLTVAGNSNLVCELQKLNPTNDTWISAGVFTLNSSGLASLTNSLINGYGYFRAKATNNTYFSTNAFGAMSFTLPYGYSIIGNPFEATYLTDIFPSPTDGLSVYRMTNGNWADIAVYDFGEWNHNDLILRGEGALIRTYTSNVVAQFSGLFDTNVVSKTLPPGWSLLISPLYHITDFSLLSVDAFDSTNLGGLASLPITGANPKANLLTLIGATSSYDDFKLNSSNVWTLGTNTVSSIPIGWTEGFWWRNYQTNAVTWTPSLIPIW